MKQRLVYITEGIRFQDLIDNRVTKIDVYERQINNWFIKPALLLADKSKEAGNYELELPLLTLLITFFESHGQYLLGESSQNNSKRVFISGFSSFINYLVNHKGHSSQFYDNIDLGVFYSLVRCGLLHNGYINTNGTSFLIDMIKKDKLHVLYPNLFIENNWLINTDNMLKEIQSYLSWYIHNIKSNETSRRKFENTFERFFNIG